jgi:hypothetical protein
MFTEFYSMKLAGRDVGVYRKKVVKLMYPKEKDAMVWTGLICLRIETSCAFL